jgi:hypothetical protein
MGALSRLSDAADVHAKIHELELMKQLVGKPRTPMNRLMFLVQHPVYGWIAYLRLEYLKGHAVVPEGPGACAARNAYARTWIKTTATHDMQAELRQDYDNYCVRGRRHPLFAAIH